MPTQNDRFGNVEFAIYRVAGIIHLILMLLEFLKHEILSW